MLSSVANVHRTCFARIFSGVAGSFFIKEEVKKYKTQLESTGTKYKILSETIQPDDSIVIEIKKQYNTSPVGNYLD